jgi:hypothetical protein
LREFGGLGHFANTPEESVFTNHFNDSIECY